MKKLLLTAFEPFAGESVNPALEVARAIGSMSFTNAHIDVVELPVARFQSTDLALSRLRSAEPDVVLMLGEAGRRSRVTPERVAINLDDFRIPDNVGNQPQGEPIIADGPVGYFSTLPIHTIVTRLKAARIPAAISNSAGLYLCNRLFYSVMHYIAVEKLPIHAGFMHLPYLHEQTVNKHLDVPSMSRETLTEAVRIAIAASLQACSTRLTIHQGDPHGCNHAVSVDDRAARSADSSARDFAAGGHRSSSSPG
jgi:pyroglutamyl-peptidase